MRPAQAAASSCIRAGTAAAPAVRLVPTFVPVGPRQNRRHHYTSQHVCALPRDQLGGRWRSFIRICNSVSSNAQFALFVVRLACKRYVRRLPLFVFVTVWTGTAFGMVRDMKLKVSSESDANKRWGEIKRVTIWCLQHNIITPLRYEMLPHSNCDTFHSASSDPLFFSTYVTFVVPLTRVPSYVHLQDGDVDASVR